MRTKEVNLNQYSEKVKGFPDNELLELKSAVDYEVEIIRNLNGKKINKTNNRIILKDSKKLEESEIVIVGPNNFSITCSEKDLDRKAFDLWNKPSMFTKVADTYSDFLKFVVIKYSNGTKVNLTDFVSKIA
jgi:hypothetical protein